MKKQDWDWAGETLTEYGGQDVKQTIKEAALKALHDNLRAGGNEARLVRWLRANYKYRPGAEFYLELLIGVELADLESNCLGYTSEVERVLTVGPCFDHWSF